MAGADLVRPGAALRSANVQFMGSGPGSFSTAEMRAEVPALIRTLVRTEMSQTVEVRKLKDVQAVWNENPLARIVFVLKEAEMILEIGRATTQEIDFATVIIQTILTIFTEMPNCTITEGSLLPFDKKKRVPSNTLVMLNSEYFISAL